MRLLALLLVLFLTACASNVERSKPIIPANQDYAEVCAYRIEKLGVTTPIYHSYIQGQYADTNEWWTYEKLSDRQPSGSHLRYAQGFNGCGKVFARFRGQLARLLLDSCLSQAARRDGKRYDTLSDNSNEWVKDRLKQAGLRVDLPKGAIGK